MDKDADIRLGRDSTGHRAQNGLARNLSELSRRLQAEPDLEAVLNRIVHAAVREIGAAEHAGIMLLEREGFRTAAETDPIVGELHRIQFETGEGPCIQTSVEHETVVSNDLCDEPRWPRFCPQVVELGIRSTLSLELFVGRHEYGALNVYSSAPGAFDLEAESVGLLLASHAALAMVATDTEQGLRMALNTRDLIGQAKGILMERHRVDSTKAFDMLVRSSQRRNRKLRDLAAQVALTGEFAMDSDPDAR
ncbi:MAG: GAF and ANTAR domain-containing protein [Propionibacteriaceae bacterium]|nr:GAF and ANTAR domain-containing protein [Propionibacteriaceae bacterium]